MSRPLLLSFLELQDFELAELQAMLPDFEISYTPSWALPTELLERVQILIGNPSTKELKQAKELQLLQLWSSGYAEFQNKSLYVGPCQVASATGCYGQAVSEHALALTLSLLKKINRYQAQMAKKQWQDLGAVDTLVGERVLILGAGDLGTHYAKLVAALGAKPIGIRRNPRKDLDPARDGFVEELSMAKLMDVLPSAKVVASFLPSSPETQGLANEAFFNAMSEGAYFINCGRGDLMQEDALIAALMLGRLGGAAIDVAQEEPIAADSYLWEVPNLIITPHVAGGFHLPVVRERVFELAKANIAHFLAGEPLVNEVKLS